MTTTITHSLLTFTTSEILSNNSSSASPMRRCADHIPQVLLKEISRECSNCRTHVWETDYYLSVTRFWTISQTVNHIKASTTTSKPQAKYYRITYHPRALWEDVQTIYLKFYWKKFPENARTVARMFGKLIITCQSRDFGRSARRLTISKPHKELK